MEETTENCIFSIGDRVKLISDFYSGFERGMTGKVKSSSCVPIVEWDIGKISRVNQFHLVWEICREEQIKPPLGLRPQIEWMRDREREIISAMNRYSDSNLDIPRAWACELLDLIGDIDSLA